MSKVFSASDFMERVVAWPGPDGPGYINLHWLTPDKTKKGFRGRPFKDVHSFMDFAQAAAVRKGTYKEIFFCLSTQAMVGATVHGTPIAFRNDKQATLVKALWADVDVKPEKGYATVELALDGIFAFCAAADMPPPSALVYSGGGIHVYWISDKPLTPAQWEPYAHGLRHEMQQHGLKCDAGLTTDIARVLRVPGTYNNKEATPRPVVCRWLGDSYDFATNPKIARLATLVPRVAQVTGTVTAAKPKVEFDLTNFPPGGMHPLLVGKLDPSERFTGLNTYSDMPLEIDEVVTGCEHFKDAGRTHGSWHTEPLWQLTLLASSFFEDGRALAHIFSRGHPSYGKYGSEETDQKYDQKLDQRAKGNLGWPTCQAFEAAGAKCKTCPFYGKLRSPLNLAERVKAPVAVAVLPAGAHAAPDDLELPEGYVLNDEDQICEVEIVTLKSGVMDTKLRQLFFSQLRKPEAQAFPRLALCFDTSLDMGKWRRVTVPEAALAAEQALLKSLREQGVKPYPRNQGRIVHFMTSWMHKLDQARARMQTTPFGWMREGEDGTGRPIGFSYGGKVYMEDGSEKTAGHTDPQLEAFYKPRGHRDPWDQVMKLITDQHHPALETIVAVTFAAPLMVFTGKYNCIAQGWSPDSGAHKSTSIAAGLAVWGSPQMTKESPMSSPKGVIHKLGEIKNLPVYWDEISDEEKLNQIRPMLGILTEGGGGTLLTQGREFHKKDAWQTLTLLGANKSLQQNIMRNIKDTDAQLQRVFEFEVEKRGDTAEEDDVSILVGTLDFNYGIVGTDYARYLGNNSKAIQEFVEKVQKKFNAAVAHKSEERFRSAMASCIYAGASLANAHLGTNFNLEELWAYLIEQYLKQRRTISDAEIVGGTVTNTLNAFTQFLKAHTRNALWVQALPQSKAGRPPAITYLAGPNSQHPYPVHIRFAVNDRVMQVSRERLLEFFEGNEHNGNGQAVRTGLKKHFGASEHAKISLAAGAGVAGGREHIISIPIGVGSPFVGELFKHVPLEEQPDEQRDDVTAAVTSTFIKGDGPEYRPAVDTGIAGSQHVAHRVSDAIAQAAKDLETVRQGTS